MKQMQHCLRTGDLPNGQWRLLLDVVQNRDGENLSSCERLVTASVACPVCGQRGTLTDHDINDAGLVSPSVICGAGCGFHDQMVLVGWEGVVQRFTMGIREAT